MESKRALIPPDTKVTEVTGHAAPLKNGDTLVTSDHEVIRLWADNRQAKPATGEETPSGPATVDVNDGGAGIRFNFPGMSPFRPISWEEWFDNFDRNHLLFVYEEQMEDGGASTRHRLMRAEDFNARAVVLA